MAIHHGKRCRQLRTHTLVRLSIYKQSVARVGSELQHILSSPPNTGEVEGDYAAEAGKYHGAITAQHVNDGDAGSLFEQSVASFGLRPTVISPPPRSGELERDHAAT